MWSIHFASSSISVLKPYTTKYLVIEKPPFSQKKSSVRHAVLPSVYRRSAWQMSIHIDANTTTQRTGYGLLQDPTLRLYHMLAGGTPSLKWSVAPTGRLDQSSLSLSQEDANGEHLENAHRAPPHLRWRRDVLEAPEIQILKAVFHALLGIRETYWIPSFTTTFQGKKHNYFTRLTKNDDIICLQEIHEKDEFLQAIQALLPQFRLFGTFTPNNLNAGGSSFCIRKNLLPEGAIFYTCGNLPGP